MQGKAKVKATAQMNKKPIPASAKSRRPVPASAKPRRSGPAPAVKKAAVNKTQAQQHNLKPVKMTARQLKAQKVQAGRAEFNARVKTQTPANRQNVRTSKKISGSAKNLEIRSRQSTKKQKFYIKRKNKRFKRIMTLGFIIFALVFSMLFGALAGIISLSLHTGRSAKVEEYYLQMGENALEDYSNISLLSEDVSEKNGELYIPVSSLSQLFELTYTGTKDDLRYVFRDCNGQSIRFIVGTNIAYINNTSVRMTSPSFISGGKLHIPLNFLSDYAVGLVIDIDKDKNYITIFRPVTGKDEKRNNIFADFYFKIGNIGTLSLTAEDSDYVMPDKDED